MAIVVHSARIGRAKRPAARLTLACGTLACTAPKCRNPSDLQVLAGNLCGSAVLVDHACTTSEIRLRA